MSKRRLLSLALALLLTAISLLSVSCSSPVKMIEQSKKGVLRIVGFGYTDGAITDIWMGSGFLIGKTGQSSDSIITNHHVVTGSDAYAPDEVEVYVILDDETFYVDHNTGLPVLDRNKAIRCRVVFTPTAFPDYAILQADIKIPGKVALPLAHSSSLKSIDDVYALGFPGYADVTTIYGAEEHMTVTSGRISRFSNLSDRATTVIEHTADINGGNSGGPLLNERGGVIGINTYSLSTSSKGASNISIVIEHVMQKLDELSIYYEVQNDESFNWGLIAVIVICAILAALIVLAAILIIRRRRRKSKGGPAKISIIGQSGEFAGHIFALKQELVFGRQTPESTPDIAFSPTAKGISRKHCLVRNSGGKAVLEDLGSSYGTFLNGTRLSPDQPAEMKNGDVFWLAETQQSFLCRID